MNHNNHQKISQLISKANELVSSIDNFSRTIPEGEIYHLSNRLQHSARTVPDKLNSSLNARGKTEQIRMAIKIFEALSDCRDYLHLVEKLRFGKTDDLIQKVDDISNLLYHDYPNLVLAS